ncbi:solute carrier family 15 member 4-like [Lingula anatina]|uniref:Solute carrier family 15 member 4-like n=1 Tax=Lingula anatina TaxID=7574 RepID=A0A1S3IS82_LINAN|nr:solute carrier family 15 member 4-like [Lingula anatina]|eukprot:XP_013401062.2 solute carrier family 15 member 4-like [Lingula anatina]
MLTTYSLQATLLPSPSNILVSSTFLTSFNDITVIVLTIVALVLFKSKLRWRKLKVDLFSRMGIGVACAVISAFFAINMETARKADFKDHNGNASLSVFILLPQYALVGAGEIMTLVSGMEMAFLGAPRGLRCTALGLFWTATGLGYFAAFGVLAFVNKYEKGMK